MFGYKFVKISEIEHIKADYAELVRVNDNLTEEIKELLVTLDKKNEEIDNLKKKLEKQDVQLITDVAEVPLTKTKARKGIKKSEPVETKSKSRRKVVKKEA